VGTSESACKTNLYGNTDQGLSFTRRHVIIIFAQNKKRH
jgi:hypothetical protein